MVNFDFTNTNDNTRNEGFIGPTLDPNMQMQDTTTDINIDIDPDPVTIEEDITLNFEDSNNSTQSQEKKGEASTKMPPSSAENNMFVSEQTIKFKVNILNDFNQKNPINVCSDPVYARELPWKILIQKRPIQGRNDYRHMEASSDSADSLMETDEENELKQANKKLNGLGEVDLPPPPYTEIDKVEMDDNGLPKLPNTTEIDHPLSDNVNPTIKSPRKRKEKEQDREEGGRVLRSHNRNKDRNFTTGFFLQCSKDKDSHSHTDIGWTCQASALLRIMPSEKYKKKRNGILAKPEHLRTEKEKQYLIKNRGKRIQKQITHNYKKEENDWGYASYIPWKELTNEKYGYREPDGTVRFEVDLFADAPHGTEQWDSKKMTGFIGLKNQGATCYMNSVLQALFFTNQLRNSIYQIPTDNEETNSSIPLALQRVFYELQNNTDAACTRCLTKAFGWETYDAFMQHDAQELIRKLIDSLEMKMKGTKVESQVKDLFEGKTISYMKCTEVDYGREREEIFYDIQLPVKLGGGMFGAMPGMPGMSNDSMNDNSQHLEDPLSSDQETGGSPKGKEKPKNYTHILDSFREYVKPDKLDGDNKWDTGSNYGKQDAEKGTRFKKFPPVLHLQLMRFNYDPYADAVVKSNDKFVFTQELDLSEFEADTDEDGTDPCIYQLQAVLVHAGEHHGGHYVAYIDPYCNNMWYKFDDDVVAPVSTREAMHANYGKPTNNSSSNNLREPFRNIFDANFFFILSLRSLV